jgi:hypothetical protein
MKNALKTKVAPRVAILIRGLWESQGFPGGTQRARVLDWGSLETDGDKTSKEWHRGGVGFKIHRDKN